VVKGHANTIKQIASHPTLPLYASVGDDRALNIWHSETRGLVSFLKLPSKGCSVAFHPNGRDIAVGLQSGDIHVYTFPDESGNGDWIEVVKKKTGNKDKKAADMAGWGRNRKVADADEGEGEGEEGGTKKVSERSEAINKAANERAKRGRIMNARRFAPRGLGRIINARRFAPRGSL